MRPDSIDGAGPSEATGIIVTDERGRITHVTDGVKRLGFDDVLLGIPLEKAFPDLAKDRRCTDSVPNRHRHVVRGMEFDVYGPISTRDGSIGQFILVKKCSPPVPSDSKLKEFSYDIEKVFSLSEVVAGIAHEVNNPLSFISGWIQMMLMDAADDDPKRETLRMLEQETERIARLIASLLDFARHHSPEKLPLSAVDVLEDVLVLVEYQLRTGNINVLRDFDPGVPQVYGDRHQLRQVFLNCIINARQAMGDGGTLTVRAKGHPGSLVKICFEDTGCGIPPETIDRIFEPFFTTKEGSGGTGLGLSTTRNIVEEHNGKIDVESTVGKGTTLTIWLPPYKKDE